jgi:hypothetical protein
MLTESKNPLNITGKEHASPPVSPLDPTGEDREVEKELKLRARLGLDRLSYLSALLTGVVLLALWQLLTLAQIYPPYILPSPEAVAARFSEVLASGAIWRHTWTTLLEALLGFG